MKLYSILFYLALLPVIAFSEGNFTYTLHGLRGDALTNSMARLNLELGDHRKVYTDSEIKAFMLSAANNIRAAIQPYGYFQPKITKILKQSDQRWSAVFKVKPGAPVILQHVDVHIIGPGANDYRVIKFKYKTLIQRGDQLNTGKYKKIKQELFNYLINLGYLKANIEKSSLFINRGKKCAEITIIFNTGKQFRFGKVIFRKNPLSNKLLRKYIRFKYKDPFNNAMLQELQDSLSSSAYFESVSVTPNMSEISKGLVPIYVRFVPKKPTHYDVGVGYGTDTGIRGLLGVQLRHITRSGQYFQGRIQASQIDSSAKATYVVPGINPVTDQYSINATIQNQNQNKGNSFSQILGLNYATILDSWNQNIGVFLLNEKSTLEEDPSLKNCMMIPNVSWSLVNSDNLQRPNNGYRISFSLQGSLKSSLSTVSFFQAFIGAKYLYTLQPTQTRFLLCAQLDTTVIENIRALPFSLQAFAGGANSVRGYAYNSIGPGNYLSVGSIEVQQKIIKNWYLVAFVDSGSVSNNPFKNFQTGIGGGVMWRSPIGSIELTVAQAENLQHKPWQIQFSIGAEL